MSVAKSFAACSFAPAAKDITGNPTLISPTEVGTWKTTSFFIDSSCRSSFSLPLELVFVSTEDLDVFLASKCLDPAPQNVVKDETEKDSDPRQQQPSGCSLGFEVKSSSVNKSKDVVVEGITIVTSSVNCLTVSFETEVTVRAANHEYDPSLSKRDDEDDDAGTVDAQGLSVLTNLEITPVLTTKKVNNSQINMDIPDLMALELGAIPDHMQKESSARVHETRLCSMELNVTLTHAFTISLKSVQGPALGNTLVSLTIRHSNSHSETVTITNIAMHPGHSRYEKMSKTNRSMAGGQYSVTNMTKSVKWGYVPKTELTLPLRLAPHDAYSTVLTVNAGEEMHSRYFVSPISVTGIVGKDHVLDKGGMSQRLVVAADARWATELVAVEPVDAFRIEMVAKQSDVVLGQPMLVNLRVFNLSLEARNLMLLMAKNDIHGSSPKDEAVNSAVVSEIDGYTFGVWGISGEDDGTVRLNRDSELLAVDGALLVGEVLGQHAIDVELRFVPLREGDLKVPNWKLYDKSSGKWYTCTHNLSIVARTP